MVRLGIDGVLLQFARHERKPDEPTRSAIPLRISRHEPIRDIFIRLPPPVRLDFRFLAELVNMVKCRLRIPGSRVGSRADQGSPGLYSGRAPIFRRRRPVAPKQLERFRIPGTGYTFVSGAQSGQSSSFYGHSNSEQFRKLFSKHLEER